jgi:adenylate cyclase
MKARNVTIDATVLFADLRGYTAASRSVASSEMTSTLDAFYDECAEAIWEHDGLLNKTIGDAIMAVFNFSIRQDYHSVQAVKAARRMQERWRARHPGLVEGLGLALQLPFLQVSESMGNHDSKIVDAASVD